MRLTSSTTRVVTRTAPLPAELEPPSRLIADGIAGDLRVHAYLFFAAAEKERVSVHRYVYRLIGGPLHDSNAVCLRLVSDGNVVHEFASPRDVVNDGRWYVHEHTTEVPRDALTYARFEAIYAMPGIVALLRRESREAAPQPLGLRACRTAPREPPPSDEPAGRRAPALELSAARDRAREAATSWPARSGSARSRSSRTRAR